MNWDKDYELIMKNMGLEPYACLVKGCPKVLKSTFDQMIHYKFGVHDAA